MVARTRTNECPRNAEKGLSLVSVIFSVLALSTMSLTIAPLLSNDARSSVENLQGQQAFYIADGGLNYILAKDFMNDTDFSDNVAPAGWISLSPGQFSVQYSNLTATTADITVTGQVENSIRQVLQSVTKVNPGSGNIHANNVTATAAQGGGGTIDADITYNNTLNIDPDFTMNGTTQVGPPPPAVNVQSLIDLTTSTHAGSLYIGGDYTGNVYVTGDVTIAESGTIDGIIVAEGPLTVSALGAANRVVNGTLASRSDIYFDIKQDSIVTMNAQEAGGTTQPILAAEGTVLLSFFQQTDTTLTGDIEAGNNIELYLKQDDTVSIEGSLSATNNIWLESKQNSDLSVQGNAGGGGGNSLQLSSWKEL